MIIPRLLLFCLPLSICASAHAQDLIDNGSFEEFKGKLKKPGSLEMVRGWVSPTDVKADLFSARLEEGYVSAMRNPLGSQTPRSGDHFAGIRVYSPNEREPRQYLQTTFTEPMEKGRKYCVKYHVSLSDLSRFSTSNVRAFISKVPVEKNETVNLTYNAQVPQDEETMFNDLKEWQAVCGIYEAQGGEQHMIIGNFVATKGMPVGKVKKPKGEPRPQQQVSYYYIDDVSVKPIKLAAECDCVPAEGRSEFIFSRGSINDPSLSTAQKVDRQVVYFRRFQSDIHSSMRPYVKELADLLGADPSLKIKLVGHIDEMEADRSHLEDLGEDRAEAVKAELEKNGVAADRISVSNGRSDTLVDTAGTEIGMSKNRRVEVELVK